MSNLGGFLGGGPPPSNSESGSGGSEKPYLTPWLDYASTAVPTSHDQVMWWAQYLWLMDGNYRSAMERVASHFLTTLDFPDLSPGEESVWRDLFTNDLDYRRELIAIGYDLLCFSNSFPAVYLPFKRFLCCSQCGLEQPIDRVQYQIQFGRTAPYLTWRRMRACPRCGNSEPYTVTDRQDGDLSRIHITRYAPDELEVAENRYSGRKDIYWKVPNEDRSNILSGARIHIDTTPLEVLEAVASGGRLKFNEDMILHLWEPTISSVRVKGWGMPRSVANFRSAWLQQLTNKADQAVAIDYTLAMRLISPRATAGGRDPMQDHGMSQFSDKMREMIRTHRNNPTTYHTAPYPVEYQFLGGEGNNMVPHEKLKFRQQEFLNQLGVPLEYHQMNLSTQAAPMALRLFESYWQMLPAAYNRVLDWLVGLVSRVYGMPATQVVMQKTTIADDMERKAVLLQLMSANQISPQTALKPFGIEAHEEVKKVMRHQEFVEDQQAEQEERDMQRAEMGALKGLVQQPTPMMLMEQQQMAAEQQMAGGMPPGPPGPMGGAPMGGMPGVGADPKSLSAMSEQAWEIAQQLVSMDEYTRRQELKALREGNKDLHALVRQNMDEIRSQARSEGGQMLLMEGQMQ